VAQWLGRWIRDRTPDESATNYQLLASCSQTRASVTKL